MDRDDTKRSLTIGISPILSKMGSFNVVQLGAFLQYVPAPGLANQLVGLPTVRAPFDFAPDDAKQRVAEHLVDWRRHAQLFTCSNDRTVEKRDL